MLKVNELFSGIGAQAKAFERLGIEHEITSTADIDHYAIISYAAIHCGLDKAMFKHFHYPDEDIMKQYLNDRHIGYDHVKKCFIDWFKIRTKKQLKNLKMSYIAAILSKQVGDISKVDELPKADLWTYSFPCFAKGTLVLTDTGYKCIEQIKHNDIVLTHSNSYQRVVKPMKQYADKIIRLSCMCSEDLLVTEKHPFYVRKFERINTHKNGLPVNYRKFGKPQWIKANQLNKKCYLGIAINQKSELPNWNGITLKWSNGRKNRFSNIIKNKFTDNDFWWVIGRYLGDGWLRAQGGIIICCERTETEEITSKLKSINFNYCISKERTVNKIHIPFKEIGEYCKQFGKGAENKQLTADIINLPPALLKSFVDGYISADGYIDKTGLVKCSSVSKKLIYGIGQCVAKAYHRPYSVYKYKINPTCVIENRTVNQKQSYQLTFKPTKSKQDKAFFDSCYIWCPINKIINNDYNGHVYNLEVENDNSYTANNIIVHNCTDISNAGLQKGFSKGSNTRSGLLWEVERLLKVSAEYNELPTYLLLENVKNLVGKKFKSEFDKWLQFLDSLGYKTYWKVLNAKDFEVPQNRERVFAISILKSKNQEFEFPKAVPLELRLKDVLESNVDEKYYLSDDVINTLNAHLERNKAKGNGFGWKPTNGNCVAHTVTTEGGYRPGTNFIIDME